MRPTIKAGEVLDGRYAVERIIGEGGMGVVVAARHVTLDTLVAIKVLRAQAAEVWKQRFLREARAASRLESEHVARVFDVGLLNDGTPFMVMELLEGRDLDDVVYEDGPLPIDEAVTYTVQACKALAAAHQQGIVHRDVKPANLFLTRDADGSPCIKLLDFGISKVEAPMAGTGAALTRTNSCLGSPHYMSPEQLGSCRSVDNRADLWSVGTSLFELLAGEAAFDGCTLPELYSAVLRDPPRRLRALRPEVPAALEVIVLRCLAKEADARVQSAEELIELLEPFMVPGRAAETSTTQDELSPSSVDELDQTPAATVRPVAVASTPPRPRAGLSLGGGLVAGGLVGAALAVVVSWPPDKPPPLSTSLQVDAEPIRIIQRPAAATAVPASAPPFVYSAELSERQHAELEGELTAATEDLAQGQLAKAVERAQNVMRQLQALGVEPHKAHSSLGARSQLILAQAEAAKVRALLAERPAKIAEVKAWAKRLTVRLAHARVAHDKVSAWGVRSFYRCSLVQIAQLDHASGQAFAGALEHGADRDRPWTLTQARRHLKHARIGLRHAMHVESETMLCVAEARRALGEVRIALDLLPE